MLPTVEEARRLLIEGEKQNPGPWKEHSFVVGECAGRVAEQVPGMDAQKAYILGILHDIGRRFGTGGMSHVMDGYNYMTELGYDEAARICLTHSFSDGNQKSYVGKVDISPEQYAWLGKFLEEAEYDDYDRLIQLCDSVGMSDGPADLETRMSDVRRRYGSYPQAKWEQNFALKRYFEEKMGRDLYEVINGKAE